MQKENKERRKAKLKYSLFLTVQTKVHRTL